MEVQLLADAAGPIQRLMTELRNRGKLIGAGMALNLAGMLPDDFRIGRDLSLGLGVREELQTHVADRANLMPRAGFSWNPFFSSSVIKSYFAIWASTTFLRALARSGKIRGL